MSTGSDGASSTSACRKPIRPGHVPRGQRSNRRGEPGGAHRAHMADAAMVKTLAHEVVVGPEVPGTSPGAQVQARMGPTVLMHACRRRVRHAERRPRTSRLGRGPRVERAARASPSSACPTPPSGRHATASAPPSSRAGCPGRCGGSRSTWPRRACARAAPVSTFPSPSASSSPPARSAPPALEGLAFCGELGLNGALRHVPGMIALADATAASGLVVPLCDVPRRRSSRGDLAHGVDTLAELARVLSGPVPLAAAATGTARRRFRPDTRPGRRARPDPRPRAPSRWRPRARTIS